MISMFYQNYSLLQTKDKPGELPSVGFSPQMFFFFPPETLSLSVLSISEGFLVLEF